MSAAEDHLRQWLAKWMTGCQFGKLIAKKKERLITYGNAHVFYPVASAERCTACLLLDIDPIGLVRNHRGGLPRYVERELGAYLKCGILARGFCRVPEVSRRGRRRVFVQVARHLPKLYSPAHGGHAALAGHARVALRALPAMNSCDCRARGVTQTCIS